MFITSLSQEQLTAYVVRQVDNFFPDGSAYAGDVKFKQALLEALDRTEYCFRHVSLSAYHDGKNTLFSHLHSDQYALFLWFLSNSVWKAYEDTELASKLFALNKALNHVVCMYDAQMPNIFLIIHGGAVLGKATYSDFFVCYQGCTVGAIQGVYPKLGRGVAMAPNSTIVGNCNVGDHVTIGNGALLRNTDLLSGMTYYRDIDTARHISKPSEKDSWAQSFFNVPILSSGEMK